MSIPWGPEGVKEWERIRSQPIPSSWNEVWPPKVEPVGQKYDPNQPRGPHTGQWVSTPGSITNVEQRFTAMESGFSETSPRKMNGIFKGRVANSTALENPVVKPNAPFTKDDLNGLRNYLGSTKSFDINKVLRGPLGIDSPEAKLFAGVVDDVHQIDSAMDHSGKIGKPVNVVRVTKSDPSGEIPDFNPDQPQDLVGKSYVEKGYGSTTTDESWAEELHEGGKGTLWRLTVSPDVKAIWGANPTEEELLLNRDLRVTVKRIQKWDMGAGVNDPVPPWIVDAVVEPA